MKKFIVGIDECRERYGLQILTFESFWAVKNEESIILLPKGGEQGITVLQIAKILLLLRLRFAKRRKERDRSFMQYIEVTAPQEMDDDALSCNGKMVDLSQTR